MSLCIAQFFALLMLIPSAQDARNRTLVVHEQSDSLLLIVFPGSELSITEITECKYFSPLKPIRELKHKSE